jgi:hypothetical protein
MQYDTDLRICGDPNMGLYSLMFLAMFLFVLALILWVYGRDIAAFFRAIVRIVVWSLTLASYLRRRIWRRSS